MKEYRSLERSEINALYRAKEQLQEQTQKFLKLQQDHKELTTKYYTLLSSQKTAEAIVSTQAAIGDARKFAGMVTESVEAMRDAHRG